MLHPSVLNSIPLPSFGCKKGFLIEIEFRLETGGGDGYRWARTAPSCRRIAPQ